MLNVEFENKKLHCAYAKLKLDIRFLFQLHIISEYLDTSNYVRNKFRQVYELH